MTDETNTGAASGSESGSDDLNMPDEMAMLKQRAKLMGITHSNNISLETLRQKIADAMEGVQSSTQTSEVDTAVVVKANPLVDQPVAVTGAAPKKKTLRQHLVEENMRLIRLRIVNLDPKKKDLPGEFFTVANEYLGTVTKYIPYGEATEGGYHVPYCIYKMLRDKKFLSIRTKNDRNNSNQIKVEQRWASEFSLDILEPLTPEELSQLATAQTAAGNIG